MQARPETAPAKVSFIVLILGGFKPCPGSQFSQGADAMDMGETWGTRMPLHDLSVGTFECTISSTNHNKPICPYSLRITCGLENMDFTLSYLIGTASAFAPLCMCEHIMGGTWFKDRYWCGFITKEDIW